MLHEEKMACERRECALVVRGAVCLLEQPHLLLGHVERLGVLPAAKERVHARRCT